MTKAIHDERNLDVRSTSRPTQPDAILITAPDRCTVYVKQAIEGSLDDMDLDAVLEVRCSSLDARLDIAEWCLTAGLKLANPFEHWEVPRLLIRNTSPMFSSAV